MPFPYTFPFDFDLDTDWPEIRVSIAFDSNPLDCPLVYTEIGDVLEIHAVRGRQHALDRMEAGTLTVVLDNTSGNFYPDNGGGLYDPDIKIMKAIKVTANWRLITYDIIECFVDNWELQWQGSGGTGPICIVTATGALKIFAQTALNASYGAEYSGIRFGNVAASVGWSSNKCNIDTGKEIIQSTGGALVNVNAQNHLQTMQESELSLIYELASGIIVFEDRSHRSSAPHDTVQATFGDDVGELGFKSIEFALDDTLIFNDVRLTRTGGTEQTASSSLVPLTYSLVRSGLLNNSDVKVYVLCAYMAARYGDTVSRIKSMIIQPANDPENLWPIVLGFDIGTRIAVNLDQASVARECFIERIQLDCIARARQFETTWTLSDADQYLFQPPATDITLEVNGVGSANEHIPTGAATNWQCVLDTSDAVYVLNNAAPTDITLEVVGAGSATEHTPVGAANNYQCVSNNDDAIYVWNDASPNTQTDKYILDDSGSTGGTINSVKIYYRAVADLDPDTSKFRRIIRIGGVDYYGDWTETNAYLTTIVDTLTVSPVPPNNPWTWAEVNGMEIGIQTYRIGGGGVYCSREYVVVNCYTVPNTRTDKYALTDSDYTEGTINSVKIYYRAVADAAESAQYRRIIRISGTDYYGDWKSSAGLTTQVDTLTVSPVPPNVAWTWAEINGMEIGIQTYRIGASGVYCSREYTVVNVTPTW